MENMIVSTESQSTGVINTNGGDRQEDAEQSDAVQSSENLAVPNVCNDVASTNNVSPPTAEVNNGSEEQDSNEVSSGHSGKKLTPDHVSSSTEAYPGTARNNLPSINHQSVIIPNMEPYLEEGSLDGTVKDFQDPSSSNENRDRSSSKTVDDVDSPDQPAEPHCSNKADSRDHHSDGENLTEPAESSRRDSNVSEEQQPDTCPHLDESAATETDAATQQQLVEQPNGMPMLIPISYTEEPVASCHDDDQQIADVEPSQGTAMDEVTPPDTVENNSPSEAGVETSSAMEQEEQLVGSQTEGDSTAEPDSEAGALSEDNHEAHDLVSSMTHGDEGAAPQPDAPERQEEAECTSNQPTDEPIAEESPAQDDSVEGGEETAAAVESADCVDSSTFPTENHPVAEVMLEEEYSDPSSPQPGSAVPEDNTPATTTDDTQGFTQQESSGDEGHAIDSSSQLNTVDPSPPLSAEGANAEVSEMVQDDIASASVATEQQAADETHYHQYSVVEPSDCATSAEELEGLEPVEQPGLESNPTVCEADSSAVGDAMDEANAVVSYENQEMDSSSHHHQHVYVVDNGDGHLTLNSVPQTGSATPYHHSDSSMLVEMAPLSADGTFVNSQVKLSSNSIDHQTIVIDVYYLNY